MAKPKAAKPASSASDGPYYQLRLRVPGRGDWRLEIWQLPSPATPRLREPEFVAALKGAPLGLIEHRVLKQLARARINLGSLTPGRQGQWPLDEDLALRLGLLFRTLAPMSNLERIRQVAEGIEAMSREEAAYWLGMTLHRRNPRRILAALRIILTTP